MLKDIPAWEPNYEKAKTRPGHGESCRPVNPLLPLLHGIVRISIYAIGGLSMVRCAIQFNEVRRIGLWNGDHQPMRSLLALS